MADSAALTEVLNESALKHLLRVDHQEDLCFALWTLSQGTTRLYSHAVSRLPRTLLPTPVRQSLTDLSRLTCIVPRDSSRIHTGAIISVRRNAHVSSISKSPICFSD